jgi:hypothetical protein
VQVAILIVKYKKRRSVPMQSEFKNKKKVAIFSVYLVVVIAVIVGVCLIAL